MSRRLSVKTKLKRKMGTGTGKDYIPWILTSEFDSLGVTSVIRDWKTGRQVHLLSQAEAAWYYILRWDDNNVDVREQYPLKNSDTVRIARENGIKHPYNENHIMTVDFLVTKSDGSEHAYGVKPSRHLGRRELEKLCIEKIYWNSRNCPYTLLYKTDVNLILASNIRQVVEFYDPASVFDFISAIKHKIAIKEVVVDMEHEILTSEYLRAVWEGAH